MSPQRIRATLLRLAAPFRRRHPIVLGGVTEAPSLRWQLSPRSPTRTDAAYAAERDPTDEAGA